MWRRRKRPNRLCVYPPAQEPPFLFQRCCSLLANTPQDIEAQKQTSATGPQNPIAASTQYHRAGRGGAGNFHDSTHTGTAAAEETTIDPVAVQQQEEQIERVKAAVAAQKPRAGGMGGRGGVGNWSSGSAQQEEKQREEEEQKKVQEFELKVLKDVEAGLAMPKPAYQRAAGVKNEE